jgi:hypothetical protein
VGVPSAAISRGPLIAVGVVSIAIGVLGVFFSVFVVGMALGMSQHLPHPPSTSEQMGMLTPFFFCCGGSVSLVWLGIGALLARRWARALMLVFSWLWLLVAGIGVLSFVVALVVGSRPTGFAEMVPTIFASLFMAIFFIGMPIGFIVVFTRPSIREAFETLDPTPRWTDRCPLPLLGLAFVLVLVAAAFVLLAFGGADLGSQTGTGATLGWLLLAVLVLVCAIGSYRRMAIAWWIICALVAVAVTLTARDMLHEQEKWPLAVLAGFTAPTVGFLVWIRRAFG